MPVSKRIVLHVLGLLALLSANVSCEPTAMKAVESPRSGRPLNGRMAIVYSKDYQIDLAGFEKLHPFDINKYASIYTQLVADGWIAPRDVYVPSEISRRDLLRVHTAAYLDELRDSHKVARYLEADAVKLLPSKMVEGGLARPFRLATGGTLLASELALEHGVAINIGGGYHHARPDRGAGFCLYADMPVAIRALQAEGRIERALVVDVDVHQGDGTAVCFAGDDSVFTFSIHQDDIFPVPKAISDLDVGMPGGSGDREVLRELARRLPEVFDRARPDIVYLQAGCDMLAGDPLADFRMTREGIVRRDLAVVDECVRRGVPVVMVLGGGYSDEAWKVQYVSIREIVRRHGRDGGGPAYPPRKMTVKEKGATK